MINSPVELAQQAVDQCAVESEGSLLVIGATSEVLEILSLLNAFSVSVFCVDSYTSQEQVRLLERVNLIEAVVNIQLSGYLGNFTVTGVANSFDLVLDLRQEADFQSALSPIGYFQLTAIGELPRVVEQLNDLVGIFDKPKYFSYLEEKCAHSRNQIEGCRQCIDICSADAITSVDFQIVVNPYLCQGCGDCSVVCPSGAMNYQYLSRQDILNQLRSMLKAFYSAGGRQPVVVFFNAVVRRFLAWYRTVYLLFAVELFYL